MNLTTIDDFNQGHKILIAGLKSQSRAYAHGRHFLYVGTNYKMDNSGSRIRNVMRDNSNFWIDQEMLDNVSIFDGKSDLVHAFTKVPRF